MATSNSQAYNIELAVGFTLMIIGGCVTPLFRAEGIVGLVSNLTPHAHAIQAYLGIISYGSGLVEVLPHILILFGFAVVFFLVAMWRFKFE